MIALLGPTLSVEFGEYYYLDNTYLDHRWLAIISIFSKVHAILEKEDSTYSVIEVLKYPREIGDNSSGDIDLVKANLIEYCFNSDIVYLDRFDILQKEQLLSTVLKNKGQEVCNYLKNSMLTFDILENIAKNNFPNQKIKFTEKLELELIDFKSKSFVDSYISGIFELVDRYPNYYYLSDESKTDIYNEISLKFKKFLAELNFEEIGEYDFNVLVEDVAGTVGGLIMGVLPIGTIKETYSYFKNKKHLKNNSDILIVLSLNLLSKIFFDHIDLDNKFQICKYCSISMAEGFNKKPDDIEAFILNSEAHVCYDHLIRYQVGRNQNQLTRYNLFEFVKQI